MKLKFLLTIIFLGFLNISFSQKTKDLVGTWYGKIPAYRFKQDGPAQCFSKQEVSKFTRLVIIDSSLNYTYQEFNGLDTTKYKGHVSIFVDTITFENQNYFLFGLTKSQLIYSIFPINNSSKLNNNETDKTFEPVEVNAEYSQGKYELLKLVYSSLLKQKSYSKDSVYLNSYEMIISKEGNLELSTIKEISAKTEYFDSIKSALSKLPSAFFPLKQNGRFVAGRYKLMVTY